MHIASTCPLWTPPSNAHWLPTDIIDCRFRHALIGDAEIGCRFQRPSNADRRLHSTGVNRPLEASIRQVGPKSAGNASTRQPKHHRKPGVSSNLNFVHFSYFHTEILGGKPRRQFLTKITFLQKIVPESSRSSLGSSPNILSIACGCPWINIGSIPEPSRDQKFPGPKTPYNTI